MDIPWNRAIGNHVHDNQILMTGEDASDPEHYDVLALGWLQEWPEGILFDPSSDNWGANNVYWYPQPEGRNRYAWGDDRYARLSDFIGTPGEEDGRYLSDAEKARVLNQAGIPLWPQDR